MSRRQDGFSRISVARAAESAGLKPTDVKSGPHPDTGDDCLHLAATIQQYSTFLASLAVQHRTAGRTASITESVQLQIDDRGDTVFWFPGVRIGETWIPGARPGE